MAVDKAGIDIPETIITAAINDLPAIDIVCNALPHDAHSADKAALVAVLASPDREALPTITPSLGHLVATVARNLYGHDAPPKLDSLSQLRPIVATYRKAMNTQRLPPSLLHALDEHTPKGLNQALDALRQTAIKNLSAEARDVILGCKAQPLTKLEMDGVRFPLADILSPMLAAALSATSNGHRISVPQARQILFGDESRLDEIEASS
jgi:hypothetical protein